MKTISGISILTSVFLSCSNYTKQQEIDSDYLLSYDSEFIMYDGEDASRYYTDRGNFIKPNQSANYYGDTLEVTTLHEINSCGKSIGIIKLANDTIYLSTQLNSDEI